MLGWALGAAGLVVAVTAPVAGQWFDATARRKLSLGILTSVTVVLMAAMFFVRADYHYLWVGLVLLAVGSATFELSHVPYFAMLRQVSTPANVGRVSGFGWSMGYFGGILLLLLCYVGFIAGKGDYRGVLGVPVEDGLNIRLVAVLAAVWFAGFAVPLFLFVPEVPRTNADPGAALPVRSFLGSYRVLWRDVRELWRADRRTVGFLLASAIFRDGLAGVFTFGAILAVRVYGIADSDVLLFGIAANVVAAVGALVGGRFDDRVGPKAVIVTALIGMIIGGAFLLVLSGPLMFWIFGLLLTVFVGPAQASARAFLARLAPPGREGQLFGLYATTGRAVSFLAPTLFGFFVWAFDAERAGIVGLLLVLIIGLMMLLPVRGDDLRGR
ncbi:putative MFS-type transporter YxiO [Nocardia seriolae]|uniref:MFS-type transporter YxiO n=1 Tax=Nocardia seriolae TaxID=37332 RepID=A0ABC9Z4U2_9NOCA|nr:putative MFS-type transporter YxiO [Nocardia seriolae]GEM28040.1 MFS transporter [Nocardia seriolae NBRC 15557]BEK85909.1 MFS transporter [Nocardia seriolae]BEK98151.1 MFS transporter [Nocardia seriolae]GAM50520.1 permease [Nocardia seriolae]